jgi:hypothetical protein
MLILLSALLSTLSSIFSSRAALELEHIALEPPELGRVVAVPQVGALGRRHCGHAQLSQSTHDLRVRPLDLASDFVAHGSSTVT